jgi:hypothetical protein
MGMGAKGIRTGEPKRSPPQCVHAAIRFLLAAKSDQIRINPGKIIKNLQANPFSRGCPRHLSPESLFGAGKSQSPPVVS